MATEIRLNNPQNTYGFFGKFGLSQTYEYNNAKISGAYGVKFERTKGKFKYSLSQDYVPKTFQMKDMGYLQQDNMILNNLEFNYTHPDPVARLLSYFSRVEIEHQMIETPFEFNKLLLSSFTNLNWKNNWNTGFYYLIMPVKEFDYYEPRVDGSFFVRYPFHFANFFLGTNHSKRIASNFHINGYYVPELNSYGYTYGVTPNFRLNTKVSLSMSTNYNFNKEDIGYVEDQDDSIVFGTRDLQTITNSLDFNYIFNSKMGLNIRLRHYWSIVKYQKFHLLQENGYLSDLEYRDNADKNFNAYNFDFAYSWNFAPGSEFSFVWKNSLFTEKEQVQYSYIKEAGKYFNEPQTNSVSLKILYYLDYQYLIKKT